MTYIIGVFIPLILQALLEIFVIESNSANGSMVGLGALLIGFIAIPATAIVNIIYISSNRKKNLLVVVARCFGIAAIMPLIVLILYLIE